MSLRSRLSALAPSTYRGRIALAIAVALVVAVVFVSAVTAIDLALIVVPLFVLAMACLMVSALLFLRETQLAAAQLRRRF